MGELASKFAIGMNHIKLLIKKIEILIDQVGLNDDESNAEYIISTALKFIFKPQIKENEFNILDDIINSVLAPSRGHA